mgnify:FL=1
MHTSNSQTDLRVLFPHGFALARRALPALLAAALAISGCSGWLTRPFDSATSSDPVATASAASESDPAPSKAGDNSAAPAVQKDEKLVRALSSESAATGQAKLDAIKSWQRDGKGGLPGEISQLADDPNPRVRAAYVEAAAQRRVPEAEKLAIASLQDHDLQVRLAAIAALGTLGGEQSSKTLVPLLDASGELVRAAAARALIQLGDERAAVRAQKDRSWRVRLVAAETLATRPDATGVHLARQLIDDPSAEVQKVVVRGVAKWPLPLAGPILLSAMASNARVTRQEGAAQLAAQWSPAAEFPVDGNPGQRAKVLGRLHNAFRGQFPEDPTALAADPRRSLPTDPVRTEEIAEVERCIAELRSAASIRAKEQAVRQLTTFGPHLVEVLEQVAARSPLPLPEAVYQEALAQCASDFAALAGLRSRDLTTRRSAADELLAARDRQALGALALGRLTELVKDEPDPVVWRIAFNVVAEDSSEPSARLAYAGIRHAMPEVRRMACLYLTAHPSPKHAPALIPSLGDTHPEVVRQAIRALGAGGELVDSQPLRQLLGAREESLRVEAATALARLGDPAGPPALERLAHSRDVTIRRQAAAAMGQVPDPAYKATLSGLLNDQYSVRLAALESLSKISPSDSAASDAQETQATSTPLSER